ncbi:RGG repeats nuclear RNA binding protein A [Brachypodium distachyon]|uniref:Hyaluronan/mRNA-binding protein domain-containing protein n=1 Tax=Brachypodium distachyon TaxID=15368 RepID=I1HR25_BRADI|nr:RGG repeats nuclear RNA binding protein A [Brachypodium distachyon]KQK09524.1 hypothetical protein BRADI_2g48500v3 [Brachypodium distachyon]|eukprot:XP_003569708.1 RGG repeats nuclear RNA binding protein A [Brachypodium distachyon]
MSTLNPFDILGADDNDDPSQLLAAAAAAAQKAEAKKPAAVPAGKAAPAAAKLPTKPAPPAQSVRDARSGGAPSRGGFGRGEPGRGRGGRGYGQNRDFGGENMNGYQGGYGGAGFGDGAVSGGGDGDRERGPRPPFRGGGGRRGGYRNGEYGDDSERPPRRNYERHSGTGRGFGMKRDGAGRGNWGSSTDEGLAQETDEALKIEDNAPIAEKQDEHDDPPTTEENKDNKDVAAKEEEENEEDKEMTLEEFEKIREEKRKALLALKTEERKVELDKDLQSLQPLSTKKANDEIFIKLGSDKDKKKESAERDERAKKSVSINEFLKPAEGERYYGGRGRGRGGRGDRGGFRGGYGGGGYQRGPAAPSIQDQAEFPTLGGK